MIALSITDIQQHMIAWSTTDMQHMVALSTTDIQQHMVAWSTTDIQQHMVALSTTDIQHMVTLSTTDIQHMVALSTTDIQHMVALTITDIQHMVALSTTNIQQHMVALNTTDSVSVNANFCVICAEKIYFTPKIISKGSQWHRKIKRSKCDLLFIYWTGPFVIILSIFKPVQMHHLEYIGRYQQICITYCCAPTSDDLNYNKESKQQNG